MALFPDESRMIVRILRELGGLAGIATDSVAGGA